MQARLNHVTKVSTFTMDDEEVSKLRAWFDVKIGPWPTDVDDHSAVEDAIKEIIRGGY